MPEELRALIVDDEELARRGLEIRLASVDNLTICGHCRNGREAVESVQTLKPNLVFLDVQMPGMDGFETLKQLAGIDMPAVVFVTAFAEHAIRAFEENAIDYLLKPIDDRRLYIAIDRVREHLAARNAEGHRDRLLNLICDLSGESLTLEQALDAQKPAKPAGLQRLAIKDGKTTVCVEFADIDWIEAAGDYLCVHAKGATHVMRGTMKRIEEILSEKQFARVHRSTIVNLDRVQTIRSHTNGEYFLTLDGMKDVKVSRSYRDCIKQFTQENSIKI